MALGQPWQLMVVVGGVGMGKVMGTNEDGVGQGRYEPDGWILCEVKAGRMTLRAAPT